MVWLAQGAERYRGRLKDSAFTSILSTVQKTVKRISIKRNQYTPLMKDVRSDAPFFFLKKLRKEQRC